MLPSNVMRAPAAGFAENEGTLAVVIAGAEPAVPPRGVVLIPCEGGKAAPDYMFAYIASRSLTMQESKFTTLVS